MGSVNHHNYKKYCDDRNVIAQDREIRVAFLLKVQEIGNPNIECSLVIPSKYCIRERALQ